MIHLPNGFKFSFTRFNIKNQEYFILLYKASKLRELTSCLNSMKSNFKLALSLILKQIIQRSLTGNNEHMKRL